jgi:hypothetical protein
MLYVYAGILIVLVIIAVFLKEIFSTTSESNKDIYLPYAKKLYLMTNAERTFFKSLTQAVGNRYYIVPQVELCSIVEVATGEKEWRKYRNMIDRKSMDFVLFDPEYFTPQLVIELDDKTHEQEKRIKRDDFVDAVLEKAGIRIKHVKTAYQYNLEEIITILIQ